MAELECNMQEMFTRKYYPVCAERIFDGADFVPVIAITAAGCWIRYPAILIHFIS